MNIATWIHTAAGPTLYVCGVITMQWLGTRYDDECRQLCDHINRAYAEGYESDAAANDAPKNVNVEAGESPVDREGEPHGK